MKFKVHRTHFEEFLMKILYIKEIVPLKTVDNILIIWIFS